MADLSFLVVMRGLWGNCLEFRAPDGDALPHSALLLNAVGMFSSNIRTGAMDTTFSLMADGSWSERLVLSSVSDDDVLIFLFILGYPLLAKKKGELFFAVSLCRFKCPRSHRWPVGTLLIPPRWSPKLDDCCVTAILAVGVAKLPSNQRVCSNPFARTFREVQFPTRRFLCR